MSGLSDTSPEAQRVLTDAYRTMSPARKLRLIGQEFRLARSFFESGFRGRNPGAPGSAARDAWGAMILSPSLWNEAKRGTLMDGDIEPIEVIRKVVSVFESLGLPYAIGGSWASSLYGQARMTRDADLSVEPFAGREQLLVQQFDSDYYVSIDAARAANRERSTFNIIHVPSAFKVDVFVMKSIGYDRSLMSRRTAGASDRLFWVTPEDIVLLKLRWYRLGNEISDRQWSDILGVLRTQAGRLDETYLDRWAAELGVADLWERIRAEAAPAE